MTAANETTKKRGMGGIFLKTLIIISLYALGAILHAVWCIRQYSKKIHDLEESWKQEVGQPVILFRLFVMAIPIMIVSMVWPVWIFEEIINGVRKSL